MGNGSAGSSDSSIVSTSSQLSSPHYLLLDEGAGNVYVADTGNNKIRLLPMSSAATSVFAGTGGCGSANGAAASSTFCSPWGITFSNSNWLVSELGNFDIRQYTSSSGLVSHVAGTTSGWVFGAFASAKFK